MLQWANERQFVKGQYELPVTAAAMSTSLRYLPRGPHTVVLLFRHVKRYQILQLGRLQRAKIPAPRIFSV